MDEFGAGNRERMDRSSPAVRQHQLESVEFDLPGVVEEVIELRADLASSKGLELAGHLHLEVPRFVRGDSESLRQVLVSLIDNAINCTERGAIVIHVTVDESDESCATVRFAVSDSGIGIPRERLGGLFQAASVRANVRRPPAASDSGLVISRQLAEQMGGRIGVESEVGRGSTFWFTARLAKKAHQGSRRPAQVDSVALRVLAVDDGESMRSVLHEQLTSWGLSAATASGGEEALRLLTEAARAGAPFRVAIIDRDMPGMNGLELGRSIRARPEINQTILMILLPINAEVDPDALVAQGFSGHMSKPVRQSLLFDAIMNAIANAAAFPHSRQIGARSAACGPMREAVPSLSRQALPPG